MKSLIIAGNTIYYNGNIVLLFSITQSKQKLFLDMLQKKRTIQSHKSLILNFFPKEATLLGVCASVKHIGMIFSPFQSGTQRSMYEMTSVECLLMPSVTYEDF